MLPSAVADRLDKSECPEVLVNNDPDGTTDHLVIDGDALCSNAPSQTRYGKPRPLQTVSIGEYVAHRDFDCDDGDRPERICKRCWSALGSLQPDSGYTNTADDSSPIAATHYRWKAKGHARSVWCDLLIPDDAPMTDLRTAIRATLGLRDEFRAWAFCERSNYDTADIEIIPSKMYRPSGLRDKYDAAETTAGDALDIFDLNDGDRFYYVYDLAMPVVTYGILKDRFPSTDAGLDDPIATYGDVVVLASSEATIPSRY